MTNEIVVQYDGYIMGIINKYYSNYQNKEDLFQAGRMGLIKAFDNYDDTKGTKFTTYAFFDIKGEMSKFIQQDRGIKISRTITKLKLQIEKANIILTQKLMRQPNIKELSNFLGLEELEVVEAMQTIYSIQSIDVPMNQEGKEITYLDTIGNNVMDMTTLITLKDTLKNLNSDERQLMIKRFIEGKTQSEIAEEIGINQVQVSRKIKKINSKIYDLVA